MSNVKLEMLLKAGDLATRPFKAVQNASMALSGDIRNSQNTLKDLNAQAGKIDGFRKSSAQLAVTGQKLKDAKAEAAALAIQFKNTAKPIPQMTIIRSDGDGHTFNIADRGAYTGVSASWLHTKDPKPKK